MTDSVLGGIRAGMARPSRAPQIVRDHDDDKRRHLLVVADTRALVKVSGLTAIGFFGRLRDDVDHAVLFELEDELGDREHEVLGLHGPNDLAVRAAMAGAVRVA